MQLNVTRLWPAKMTNDLKTTVLASFLLLIFIAAKATADTKIGSEANHGNSDNLEELSDSLTPVLEEDKRIFRYGRGGILRYGKRGGLLRYGKRGGGLLRYGRGGLFRYGRSDQDEEDIFGDQPSGKRLFRWGKRSDDMDDVTADKRIFRYGKRSGLLAQELAAARAQLNRYARDQPHVPFRFGEE